MSRFPTPIAFRESEQTVTLQNVAALTSEALVTIQSSSHESAKHVVAHDLNESVTLYTYDAVIVPQATQRFLQSAQPSEKERYDLPQV